ncbi:MAG: hypothetical protein P8I62_06210 [Pseudomonadales bacterium]|nr:hypothetical protein [Pseudomonadales bacterium]
MKSRPDSVLRQIKSKERVRDLAEVYTNERQVKAMLDLIPLKKEDDIIHYRYLEPSSGNGNFLIEILRRKLDRVNEKYAPKSLREYEFYIARALSTIYGIDICSENVFESRARLFTEIKSTFDMHKGSFIYTPGFFSLIDYILYTNIVVGDSINKPEDIVLTEYKVNRREFAQAKFRLTDLSDSSPKPIDFIQSKHFLLIGIEHEQSTGINHEGKQRYFDFV